jgi:hypothetical protein
MMNRILSGLVTLLVLAAPAGAQVDQARAAQWFREVTLLCEREGGKLWGISLCGPMVIADASTRTIATSKPAPEAPRPAALGFANAAMSWGGERWSTYVWRYMPADNAAIRNRLMLHELFHRIQPQLGLLLNDGQNEHLDTPEGRYWIQLEWRALARALATAGAARDSAVRDALAFHAERYRAFPEAAENERRMEINEGLAQYTGTVAAMATAGEATADAIEQLREAPIINETLVRTFPYPSGAAYGILLDAWSPGWTRAFKATDTLTARVAAASGLQPAADLTAAAARYGGPELRVSEAAREKARATRVAELRRGFVEGPVLTVPNGKSSSFVTNGLTPIPGEGTVYPQFRTTGDWGSLEGDMVLMSTDRRSLRVPAPKSTTGTVLSGDGWKLTLSKGWSVRAGGRAGDVRVTADSTAR